MKIPFWIRLCLVGRSLRLSRLGTMKIPFWIRLCTGFAAATLCLSAVVSCNQLPVERSSVAEEIRSYESSLRRLATEGSALPRDHRLSARFKTIEAECRRWLAAVMEVAGKAGWEEDVEARMWRLKEAVHRLGMLELRTRIVRTALDTGKREPDYGLLATPGLERIVNSAVPAVAASNAIGLTAAAGERVSFRMPLIVFDRGIDKPHTKFQFVTIEQSFTNAGGGTIPDAALTVRFEDEAPMDSQRGMFQTVDGAQGIQRTDYLTGAAQDCLIGLGATSYIQFLHADTAYGLRAMIDIPANQKAGVYRGVIQVWPKTEDYPAHADITVNVVDAGAVPAPTMRIQGGFNRQAFLYMTATRQKKSVAELDAARLIADHVKLLAREGVDLKLEDTLAPHPDWLFVPDEPDGPLALNTTPLRVRLLAWQAWAEGRKGVQVATFHDWTDSWNRIGIWPGPTQPRGYNNYVKDMRRIGSLYYATGHGSLRLLMLQEGFQDAAWLQALSEKTRSVTANDPWSRDAAQALEQARKIAGRPNTVTAEELLDLRRRVIRLLAKH